MVEKLTKKQKGFVKDYIKTGNGTQSALKNYDTDDPNVANAIASENLRKPMIQDAIKSIAEQIPDEDLVAKHKELLNASALDHMIFPLGPRDEADRLKHIEEARAKTDKEGKEYKDIEFVTDEDIIEMLQEVNCKVRRIVHRETARDVYFWSADNSARDKALDKAYKLKGTYAPDKSLNVSVEVGDGLTKEQRTELLKLLK